MVDDGPPAEKQSVTPAPDSAAARPVAAADVALDPLPLEPDDVVEGAPTTGIHVLRTLGDTEVGIWEMTPGTVRDIEADEVFVVLSGAATVAFEDGRTISLGAGDVMSLVAGERTVWTVTETLRKVYVARD